MLYLSGQMGTDASGKLVPGGIEAETRQILANVRAVLERHGSSMDRVVKCLVMLADMQEWPAMNAVYLEHFKPPLPARSAFGASGLALGGQDRARMHRNHRVIVARAEPESGAVAVCPPLSFHPNLPPGPH